MSLSPWEYWRHVTAPLDNGACEEEGRTRHSREARVPRNRLAQAAGAGADALCIPVDQGCTSFGSQTCQGTIRQLGQLGVAKANRCGLIEVRKCFVNCDVMLQIGAAGRGDLSYAHCIAKHRLFGCVSPIPTRQHQTKVTTS